MSPDASPLPTLREPKFEQKLNTKKLKQKLENFKKARGSIAPKCERNKLLIKVHEEPEISKTYQSNKDIRLLANQTSPMSQETSGLENAEYPVILKKKIKTSRLSLKQVATKKNKTLGGKKRGIPGFHNANLTSKSDLSGVLSPKDQTKNELSSNLKQKDIVSSNDLASTESNYMIHKHKYNFTDTLKSDLLKFQYSMESTLKKNQKKQAPLSQMDFNFQSIPVALTPAL